jgi:hypothetical protein
MSMNKMGTAKSTFDLEEIWLCITRSSCEKMIFRI